MYILTDISRLLSQVPQLQVDSAEMNSLAWLLNESDERKRKHKGDGCYQQDSNGINSGMLKRRRMSSAILTNSMSRWSSGGVK